MLGVTRKLTLGVTRKQTLCVTRKLTLCVTRKLTLRHTFLTASPVNLHKDITQVTSNTSTVEVWRESTCTCIPSILLFRIPTDYRVGCGDGVWVWGWAAHVGISKTPPNARSALLSKFAVVAFSRFNLPLPNIVCQLRERKKTHALCVPFQTGASGSQCMPRYVCLSKRGSLVHNAVALYDPYESRQTWSRGSAVIQTKYQNEEEM